MKSEELIFILDIGTRSVIGIVGKQSADMLEIVGVESAEHASRAVVDGQIEDIAQTAKVAKQVKEKLEERLGVSLREVHVAAAGRMLKTERVRFEADLDELEPIKAKDMLALESAAVQKAYEVLAENPESGGAADFCSVGHSITGYELDGYTFSTLLGHRGKKACIELIATFLPNEVVESLYTTMSILGLSISSMTLEPIAAMSAVVPKELHLLNVALVDVGAGTSDIAVTNKGSICGYTMVTVAGDEITECVMEEYVVDFAMAEKMKFAASAGEKNIHYEDVLGVSETVGLEDFLAHIRPATEDLAKRIAEGILSISDLPPKAVFMVGGGSRTPGLCELVAQSLSIDVKRVAVGGSNYMKRQVLAEDKYLNAEYATPIGIALTAARAGAGEGFSISLNGIQLQLFGNSMTVMEALRRGGYQYNQIMGHSGKSIVFEHNGERCIVRGGLHTLAEIQVNGALTGLSTLLQAGDKVTFVPAADGEDAAPRLCDVAAPWTPFEVVFLGQKVQAGSKGWINGAPARGDQLIKQMDKVKTEQIDTIGSLLQSMGFDGDAGGLSVNGVPCTGLSQRIYAGDQIAATGPPSEPPSKPLQTIRKGLKIWINNRECALPPRPQGEPYQFFDLLNFVDIDPQNPRGDIVLIRNGATASFLEQIQDGDRAEIHWSEEDVSERIPHMPDNP